MKNRHSYIFTLRVWTDGEMWRWSLKQPGSSEPIGFADLDSLYMYLSALTETPTGSAERGKESEDDRDEK